MITKWKENEYGAWRGFILFLSDSDEYIEEEEEDIGWINYIYSYFF